MCDGASKVGIVCEVCEVSVCCVFSEVCEVSTCQYQNAMLVVVYLSGQGKRTDRNSSVPCQFDPSKKLYVYLMTSLANPANFIPPRNYLHYMYLYWLLLLRIMRSVYRVAV